MGLHWVYLMCEGISQKLWLKAKGLRFGKRRPESKSAVGGDGGNKGDGDGAKAAVKKGKPGMPQMV